MCVSNVLIYNVIFCTILYTVGYGLYNIMLLFSSFVAVLANQFSIVSMSFLLPSAECDLNLSSSDKGLLNAMSYTGKEKILVYV